MAGSICPSLETDLDMRRPHLNALLIGAGVGLSHWLSSGSDATSAGLVLDTPREVPPFQLQTAQGRSYTPDSFDGRWQLQFFGFTHCPDICPNTLALMQQVKQQMPAELQQKLDFVFVSLDPARDTPKVLRNYVSYFDPDFVGVTGSADNIREFTESLGIAYVVNEPDDTGNYAVDHATALVLLTPQGRIKAYFPAPLDRDALRQSLTRLLSS